MISGAASRFMLAKLPPRSFAAQRSQRLLIPLVFGMLVVIPLQSWAEVVEKTGYTGSLLDFWPRYLSFDQSFGLILPTYNHLWFVAYLWAYILAAAALAPLLPGLDRAMGRVLAGPGVFLAPALLFGLYRAFAFPLWPESHVIWADGYAHLQYATAFLLGLLLAQQEEAWTRLAKSRHLALLATAGIVAVGLPLSDIMEDKPGLPGVAFAFLREAYAWGVIVTLMGYARQHIRRGSPMLTFLTEAVFPFYIVHQTAIVLSGHIVKGRQLPLWAEAGVILAATVVSCIGAYALARSVPALRLPFGLKPAAQRDRVAVASV